MIFFESSERIAMTAPRMRYAVGSPPGLRPRHSTSVSFTSPMSRKRRRILPVFCKYLTVARSPGFISLKLLSLRIFYFPLNAFCLIYVFFYVLVKGRENFSDYILTIYDSISKLRRGENFSDKTKKELCLI